MPKACSNDLRPRVVAAMQCGETCRAVAARFDIAPSTAASRSPGRRPRQRPATASRPSSPLTKAGFGTRRGTSPGPRSLEAPSPGRHSGDAGCGRSRFCEIGSGCGPGGRGMDGGRPWRNGNPAERNCGRFLIWPTLSHRAVCRAKLVQGQIDQDLDFPGNLTGGSADGSADAK